MNTIKLSYERLESKAVFTRTLTWNHGLKFRREYVACNQAWK
jgi:hypothetical protein